MADSTAFIWVCIILGEVHVFQKMPCKKFALVLKEVAAKADLARYGKSQRGPKKPSPKRTKHSNGGHVSTHKILAEREK